MVTKNYSARENSGVMCLLWLWRSSVIDGDGMVSKALGSEGRELHYGIYSIRCVWSLTLNRDEKSGSAGSILTILF